jgi:hypothetical protein
MSGLRLTLVLGLLGAFAVAALHACGSGPTHGTGPTIQTDPTAEVIFSGVASGDTATQIVTVHNVGSSDLVISGIAVNADAAAGFGLADDAAEVQGVSIAPGDARTFSVTYTPQNSADHAGTLEISSNDYVTPRLGLQLRSSQKGPHIKCDPTALDFALVANRMGPITATCRNDGTDPFPVESFFIDGSAEFSFESSGLTAGGTLAVGDTFTVTVTYAMSLAANGRAYFVVRPSVSGVSRGQLPLYGPPVASAGADITVPPLEVVNLDGSRSRAPGNVVTTFFWDLTKAPAGSKTADQFRNGERQWVKEIGDPPQPEVKCAAGQNRVLAPCFFADVPGIYTFTLKVRDHRADCPLRGGGAACGDPAECCSFDCSGTCAATGGVCAESGTGCDIDSDNGVDTTNAALDSEMAVHAIPASGVYIQLKWDNDGDYDLHVVRDSAVPSTGKRWNDRSGGVGFGNDCYYGNPNPDWGVTDPTTSQTCVTSTDCKSQPYTTCRNISGTNFCVDASDDPRLLIDMITGGGPEAIEMKLPAADTYHIGVDHFPNQVDATKGNATIRVLVGGVEIFAVGLAGPITQGLAVSDFWYVGRVIIPPILSEATFEAEPVNSGATADCNTGGQTNPCHRRSGSDYPVIP